MPNDDWQKQFEAAWADREERLYPALFGPLPPNIHPLDFEIFSGMTPADRIDPRWLTHGVFEIPPSALRQSWLYVSSGLSNAWEDDSFDPGSQSGLGCELTLQTAEPAPWALFLLRRMVAFELCLAHGRFPGKPALELWNRIPLRAPIDGKSSSLTFLLLGPATGCEGIHQIPSGQFEFLNFVGITEDEASVARTQGGDVLYRRLLERNAAPVTQPERTSVLL